MPIVSGPGLSVVIPSFNGEALLRRHLAPLLSEVRARPDTEVVVADDASTDGSMDLLAREYPDVRVSRSGRRAGFAVNCNRGVSEAVHDLVLCLNSDVRVTPGFLEPLVEAMADPDVFAAAPAILLDARADAADADESRHATFLKGGLLHHLRLKQADVGQRPLPVSYACGAALLVRRSAFLALGGFDTLYAPFYWEDVDLSYRAWKRGWRVVYAPGSIVHHEHRATIARFHDERDTEAIYARNQYLFAWKNFTDRGLIGWHAACLAGRAGGSAALGRPDANRAIRLAFASFRQAWSRRAAERRAQVRTDRGVMAIFRESARLLAGPEA